MSFGGDMGRTGPVEAARGFAHHCFPDALTVIVGGSALTAHRTPMSDLDMVVVTGPREAPYRQSSRWEGWPVEVLIHDERSLAAYCDDNLARRWPGIPRLIAEGTVVSDHGSLGRGMQAEMRRRLADGPTAATPAEIEAHRYALTDLLDDLAGAEDPAETAFIACRVMTRTAQLALLSARHWQGTGKWLLRELRDHDPDLAARLARSLPEPEQLAAVAHQVLDGAGGPLWEGYRVTDPRNP